MKGHHFSPSFFFFIFAQKRKWIILNISAKLKAQFQLIFSSSSSSFHNTVTKKMSVRIEEKALLLLLYFYCCYVCVSLKKGFSLAFYPVYKKEASKLSHYIIIFIRTFFCLTTVLILSSLTIILFLSLWEPPLQNCLLYGNIFRE